MKEDITRLVERTQAALRANAKHMRNRASLLRDNGLDIATQDHLRAFAEQLFDRAEQCDAWLYQLLDGVTHERDEEMRNACIEWLRMQQ
jgi:formate dehydrogenase maturation protein FdhE